MKPHKYLPVSEKEYAEELGSLGAKDIDKLFESIPAALRGNTTSTLPNPYSEIEMRAHFKPTSNGLKYSFLGGHGHEHYVPSIIAPIISRGEFLTAYTPYQPEISQGTLQAMYEYQSMMASLMGVEISNASLYDGSTAMLEACYMACRITGRTKLLCSDMIHPEYLETLRTYECGNIFSHQEIKSKTNGRVDSDDLSKKLSDEVAAVVIQSPNFHGVIEEVNAIKKSIEASGALLIVVVTEAMSLGLLESPGKLGADIICGEAQSFGVPLSFGGPWLGFLGTSPQHVRNIPGRLIGQAKDMNGTRCFVVTLATREQHIRREKATSNICTNQGLMALRCAIYLSVMGKSGIKRAAERSARFAGLARKKIAALKGYKLVHPDAQVFNEFAIETPKAASAIFEACAKLGVAPGNVIGSNMLLVCTTELHSPRAIDELCIALEKAAS